MFASLWISCGLVTQVFEPIGIRGIASGTSPP
jgi:hypothetical protein